MWIIIIQAILSWLVAFNVINTHNDFVRSFLNALDRITEPLYRPIRRILPDFGGLDFSPMVVLLLIVILRILLAGRGRRTSLIDRIDERRRSSTARPSPRRSEPRRRGACRPSSQPPAASPAWPWCWSARIRRARSMSAPRARRPSAAGMESFEHRLPDTIAPGRAARPGRTPQRRRAVDGILVQLPLPPGSTTRR